ncbi:MULTISPECIES: MFS transporter [unclassified Rhodococcus (in: high G+C Gram-positive bacteria)]|uniref:MFS transporter n=1 Tax=unclassified Rhodococcus (in: high G+C Gram-positive bacteria) TaxID=192944 RepID=UPI000701091B|nr:MULTISPECIES: MFS transporter [unclassified Rhodococcus (in: high G+C Gram-positive bacteria)]KQU28457.1 MFS transporter [Rhodococcus sp. Leaf225]KQU47663.1 MFS transporter [Rhodococcus sp. Leaf258]
MTDSSPRRRLIGGCIGNVCEVFDYSIYALAAPALAVHFFSQENQTAALLGTFAIYALAFFARPLGGVFFGFLADRVGRLRILSLTILLMGGGTVVTGLLPTYDAIGLAAPALLVVCRLVQGLSMGGESTGGYSFVVESAPDGQRGRWIGYAVCFIYVPTSLAAVFVLGVQALLGSEAYLEWGWRIPFIAGGLIAVAGFWIRRTLDDPEEYTSAVKNQGDARSTIRDVAAARMSMVRVILLQVPQAVGAYLLVGYMFTFVVKTGGLAEKPALLSNAAAILVLAVGVTVLGALGDRIGRKPLLIGGASWLAVTAYPAFSLASSGTLLGAIAGQSLLAMGVAIFAAGYFVVAVELFPTAVRGTGHGFSFNLSAAIFGGTTPLVATALVSYFNSPVAPAFYAIALILTLGALGIVMTPETSNTDLRTALANTDVAVAPRRSSVTN